MLSLANGLLVWVLRTLVPGLVDFHMAVLKNLPLAFGAGIIGGMAAILIRFGA